MRVFWAVVAGSGTSRTWILETVGSGATSDLEFIIMTSNNFVGPVQGGTLSKNRWHHVAACRSGNTIRMFVDGVMYGSGTSISVDMKLALILFGLEELLLDTWNGFISNVRVINGTALYTSNFTPPSAPLTEVTNTKFCVVSQMPQLVLQLVSPNISGAINTGVVWSDNFTSTSNFNSSYPPSYAFDGSDIVYAEPVDTGSTMTVTFDPPLVVSGDFEVKIGSSGELFTTINGGTSTSQGSGLTQYHTLGNDITVSNFTYTSSTRPVLYSVRVNGSTLLTDPVVRNGDAAATNFNPFNTDINTVRGQETGYATLNPLRYSGYTTSDRIFTDGNLRMLGRGDGVSNFGATTGKFYAEVFVGIKSGESGQGYIGVIAELNAMVQ